MQEAQRNLSGQNQQNENLQNFQDNVNDNYQNTSSGRSYKISDQLRQSLEQDKQFQSQPFYEQNYEKNRFNDECQDDGVGGNKSSKNFTKNQLLQGINLYNGSDQDVPLQDRQQLLKSGQNQSDSIRATSRDKSPTKIDRVNNLNSTNSQENINENSITNLKEEKKEQIISNNNSNHKKDNAGKTESSMDSAEKKAIIEVQNQTALSLIYYDNAQQKYLVSDQAKNFLCSIDEKVAVIAVAGKYRTGKSFLLNRVILNKRSSGFGVGPTINPCTKGLWVWSEAIDTEYNGEKMKILVIDSEGIGAFDEDVNHDTKIFLLALLLSSNFIFNSMNTIDENAINSLSLIINLSKELQVKKNENLAETDPEEIQKFFPSFLWVVRDFSLRLNDVHGNTINQKQYLENALQPQKGNSDAVEQKNKIRRMIQLFFADRDCFTMVRPVENEKALQNLQQMQDNEFRPEFSQQITQLRNKILKRAKPKILNGKQMSGRMLLELCQAYTDAINGGSVPNIQNAWSYVCQNECQRTIKNCISNYESKIHKPLETAKEKFDLDLLKSSNKSIIEESIFQFRKDAMGGLDGQGGQEMIQELEIKLRNQLCEKYKEIKKEYIRFCKAKAKKFIDEQTQIIRRKIQQAQYESLDQVQDELNQFRSEYNGPKYPGYEIVISETMCQLLQKASDLFLMSKSQTSNLEISRQNEKIKDLEQTLKQVRIDFSSEKSELQLKIQNLQSENSQLLMSEKVMQERMKRDIEDNLQRIQKKDSEQQNLQESKDLEIKNLKLQLEQLDSQKRQNEFISSRKYQEIEKLNALIEQKMSLTEKDLTEQKQKLNDKDKELKELQKENYQLRIQNQELTSKLERAETDCQENLEKMKIQYEKQIEKMSLNQSDHKSNQNLSNANWIKEREQMTKQINLMTTQYESQKKLQEQLLQALNRQKFNTGTDQQENESKVNESSQLIELQEKNQSLLQMNNNLSMQIVQMQNKQQSLEEEIKTLKKYKKIVNNSIGFQCKHCGVAFAKDVIQEHLKICMESADRNRASVLIPNQQASVFNNLSNLHGANPSPMQRVRMSIMGQLGIPQQQNLINGNFTLSTNHFRIEIQECQIYQLKIQSLIQSNYQGVEYIFLIQNILENSEWAVTKSLSEILNLQEVFQKQYQTFDFLNHGIILNINLPQTVNKTSNDEMNQNAIFYFQDILKYEIQQFFEKLQKIPFIRDSQFFRNFFNLNSKNPNSDDQFDQIEVPSQSIQIQKKQQIKIDGSQNEIPSQTARFKQKSFACPSPLPFDRGTDNKMLITKSFIHGSPPSLNPLSEASTKQKHYEFENNIEGIQEQDKFKNILNFKSPNYDFSIPRPPSNRYRNDEDEDNLGNSQLAENDQYKQQIVQKDMDSSNVLCWTHDKLGQISVKDSRSMHPFKNNDQRNESNKINNNDLQNNHFEKDIYGQNPTLNRDKNSNVANINLHYINTTNYQSINRSYYRDDKEQSNIKFQQDSNEQYQNLNLQQSSNFKNNQSEIKKYKDNEEESLREYKSYNNIYKGHHQEDENVNTSPELSRDELQNSYSHTSTIKTEGQGSGYYYAENGNVRKESIKQELGSQFSISSSNITDKLVPVLAQHQKLQSFSGQQIVMTHHNIAKNGKMLFSQQQSNNMTDKHQSSVNSLSQRSNQRAAPASSGVKSQTSQGFIPPPQFVQPATSKHQSIKQGPNKVSSSSLIQNGNSSQPRSKQKHQKLAGPSSMSYEPVLLKQSISNNQMSNNSIASIHNYSAHNIDQQQLLGSQLSQNKINQDRSMIVQTNNKSNNASGQKLIKQNIASPKNSISNTNQSKQSKN